MADAVTSQVLVNGAVNYVIALTNISDATGEVLANKIIRANLLNSVGGIPAKLNIRQIQWAIQGFTSVQLYWDHTVPDLVDVLPTGFGFRDYTPFSNKIDPGSAGGTGNIQLSTTGAIAGASYDLTLWVLKSG